MPRCRVSDCTVKQAVFNNSGETSGICCSKHKEGGMINVKDKTCHFEDCMTRPAFNFEDKKTALYCKIHKENGMINVIDKTCHHIDCKKIPSYNNKGEKKPIYCKEHAKPEMVDLKNKTCQFDNCYIQSYFNYKGEKNGIYCKTHSLENMINVVDKTCQFIDCRTQPHFNFENKKNGIFCAKHKLVGMVDVVTKTCKNSWCTTQVSKNAKKYKDYCLRCFIHEFPDQKISRHYKIKETHVADYLKETFPDKFTFDKTVGGCSKRRPDAYLDLLTHIIIVVCFVKQHTDYDTTCEISRVNELFTDLGDRPIVFIRFNPDAYDNKPSSFKYHKTSGVPIIRHLDEWNGRLKSLKNCIDKHIKKIPVETIFEYLFYDKN